MPQEVIINGKRYLEYTPQELEAVRLEQLTQQYLKRGQFKFASSNHTTSNGKSYKQTNKIPT